MREFAEACQLLRENGFEELMAVPALPERARGRLPMRVTEVHRDRTWQLRGHGLGFDLLLPEWVRMGIGRAYARGWGLTREGVSGQVLLAQAVGGDGVTALGERLAARLPAEDDLDWSLGVFGAKSCLRLALTSREVSTDA